MDQEIMLVGYDESLCEGITVKYKYRMFLGHKKIFAKVLMLLH